MAIIAIGMMKNEEDIIGYTVHNLFAHGVDEVHLLDNLSNDNSRHVAEHEGATVYEDSIVAYHQSQKMTALAHEVAADGDWVIPFDADEIWKTHHMDGTTQQLGLRLLMEEAAGATVVYAQMRDYVDFDGGHEKFDAPTKEMVYRRSQTTGYPKVAFRFTSGIVIEQGNHGVRGMPISAPADHDVQIAHFQYRGYQHFKHKMIQGANAYSADPAIPSDWGNHWRNAAEVFRRGGDDAMRSLYVRDFVAETSSLIHDPVYISGLG